MRQVASAGERVRAAGVVKQAAAAAQHAGLDQGEQPGEGAAEEE